MEYTMRKHRLRVFVGFALAALCILSAVAQAAPSPLVLKSRNWYVVALPLEKPYIQRRIFYTRGPSKREQVIESNVWSSDADGEKIVLVIPRESQQAFVVVRDELAPSTPLWQGWLEGAPKRRAVR
jgi:hypothetical protein